MALLIEKLAQYWAYPFVRYALVVGVDWSNQQNLVIEPNFMA